MSGPAPSVKQLTDCALTVITFLRHINTTQPGMKILVIGGYALKRHLNGRDTTDVDIWVNKQSTAETETLMTKLKEMDQNRFIHYPNSFRWMHPDGVEIPVDFVRAEMAPHLANAAKDLSTLQEGVIPLVGKRGLLISKLQSCAERQDTLKATRDANDALVLTQSLTPGSGRLSLTISEQVIARRALDDLVRFTMQPRQWWEQKLGLNNPNHGGSNPQTGGPGHQGGGGRGSAGRGGPTHGGGTMQPGGPMYQEGGRGVDVRGGGPHGGAKYGGGHPQQGARPHGGAVRGGGGYGRGGQSGGAHGGNGRGHQGGGYGRGGPPPAYY